MQNSGSATDYTFDFISAPMEILDISRRHDFLSEIDYLALAIAENTPCPSPSSFIIVPMVMGRLTGKMGVEPILPITINTMMNLDGDGDGIYKQAITRLS